MFEPIKSNVPKATLTSSLKGNLQSFVTGVTHNKYKYLPQTVTSSVSGF